MTRPAAPAPDGPPRAAIGRAGERYERSRTADEEFRAQRAPLEEAHEARLVAERARYLELFEFAPVAYCVTDAAGIVVEANRALADLLGVPHGMVAGKSLGAYVDREDRRGLRLRLAQLERGESQRWELRLRPRSGASVWVEAIVARAQTDAAVGDLRWAIRDVRESKRVARELEQRVQARTIEVERARALLEAVLRQMPGGVVVVDPDLRVLLANDHAHAVLGDVLEQGERLLETLAERCARLDGSPYHADDLPLARALAHGEVVERELVQYDAGGSEPLVFEVAARPVRSESGEPAAAVSVFTDVTERRRVDRAMREFVTNAAHELQTPIAAIVSAVDVLQSGAKSRARDRDRFLGHVEQQAERLTQLVRTLLVLARAQSGIEAARDETIRLRPLLEAIAASVRAPERVSVVVEAPPELGVVANRDLLAQALVNLATNAARHTEHGTILVRAVERDDGRVAVGVRDTGAGVPREDMERVFDRFYRSDRTGGFGLGLAIVREVATVLGGEVEIESEPGVGTAVRLLLPKVVFAS